MYRRNILHISYPVAFLLGLFILYHAWIKPTYLLAPAQDQPTASTEHAQDASLEPQPSGPRAPDPQQTRLIDTSKAPNTKHRDLLEAIRHDIDTGNVREAETKLADLRKPWQQTRPRAPIWPSSGIIWAFNKKKPAGLLSRSQPSGGPRHSTGKIPSSN